MSSKEGGQEGYQSIRLYTIADVFLKGIFSCFKFQKKRLQRLGPKKGGVFYDVDALPKTQRRGKTLRYSPCGDATTVTVTIGGVSHFSYFSKIFFFVFTTPDCPQLYIAILHLALQLYGGGSWSMSHGL